MNNNFITRCSCGCGKGLSIDTRFAEEDGYVIVETITTGFSALQPGMWARICRRIRAAWLMLRGKEYCLHDMILEREHWNDFVAAVNELDMALTYKDHLVPNHET